MTIIVMAVLLLAWIQNSIKITLGRKLFDYFDDKD